MKISVESRKGKALGDFDVADNATLADLKDAFAKKNRKYYPSRQYFTIGAGKDRVPLKKDENTLSSYGIKSGGKLVFKDLGPQIAWKTVFMVEYFGPILVHSLFYFLPNLFYSQEPKEYTLTQTLGFAAVVIHFVKRELETMFVHRFSNGTMPAFNIFKNSFHYWVLSGLLIAYFLYHPLYTAAFSDEIVWGAFAVMMVFELLNFHAHLTLMWLRPPGTKIRAIPRGFGFNFFSCANYTWELSAWLVFSLFTQTLTAWFFFVVSAGQIWLWSVKKHVNYVKEFPDYPKNRDALFPGDRCFLPKKRSKRN